MRRDPGCLSLGCVLVALAAGCNKDTGMRRVGDDTGLDTDQADTDTDTDTDTDSDTDTDTDTPEVDDCGFTYAQQFSARRRPSSMPPPTAVPPGDGGVVHAEPPPPFTYLLPQGRRSRSGLVMPGYSDDMPLFERAVAWDEPRRCY